METNLENVIKQYRELGIEKQLDYDKFYLYSLITHSTAIEGSTITELENQIMFDSGLSLNGKSIIEQYMNLDLKSAYERMLVLVAYNPPLSIELLKELAGIVMKNTGAFYKTPLGDFSSAKGDLRLVNVSAGIGGRSYLSYNKVYPRLKEFCEKLNEERKNTPSMTLEEKYNLSFDAHYNLVTIHPWADGNGRMARLIMNWIQFENGLIPSKILSEDKENYIKVLVATRENGDLEIFRQFMKQTMIKNLLNEMAAFKESNPDENMILPSIKTKHKIVELLRSNPRHTAFTLSAETGKTVKAIEAQLARLKKSGVIRRVGPAKGGHWEVIN